MEEGIVYWEVNYKNTEGDRKWSVIKATIHMDEDEIISKMLDDSDVVHVYSANETDMDDYGRDFTFNPNN
jgi:hypothetical protein